jgi:DinB superfamily
MSKSNYQAAIMLNMNSRLFISALEGVTEEQANHRISDHNNSITWLGTHTVWARYNICAMLGKPAAQNPYDGKFENFKVYDPADKYPTLAEIREEWNKASALLTEALASVTEEHLAAECPFKSPIGDPTFCGTVAFLTQHESYDIGQVAFLKKYHTGEAMKY